ncbi:MAG: hypothetical protein H8F28_09525 [Fibrella sp.]|nr:hypothetical protein [Armatimonadota bacterium]
MKRFKQSGFGVTVALVNALMAAFLSVTTLIELIGLRGRLLCGNHVSSIYSQFSIAMIFVTIAVFGWCIARNSNYGVRAARCAVTGAITVWLICQFATGWH